MRLLPVGQGSQNCYGKRNCSGGTSGCKYCGIGGEDICLTYFCTPKDVKLGRNRRGGVE